MKSILLYILSFSLFAALPSVESLFRHGANPEISLNTVKLGFSVQELELKNGVPLENMEIPKKNYLLYFIKGADNKFSLLQLGSKNEIGDETALSSFYSKRDFVNHIIYKKEMNIKRDLFYSTIISMALNESKPFAYLLKKTDRKFKSNREVINKEKVQVLKRYKNYLSLIKDDPESKEVVPHPLKPEDEKDRMEVNNILNSSMYIENSDLKLVRINGEFKLALDLDNYHFKFSNKTHQFLELSYKDTEQSLSMHFKKFILFNGTHQLPSKIIYKVSEEKAYLVSFTHLSHFNVSNNFMSKKAKKSRELLKSEGDSSPLAFMY